MTAQLLNTRDGEHLWGERFDRHLDDLFTLQEEIAGAIAASIDSRLKIAERERAKRKGGQVTLWEAFQKAMWHFYKFTDDDAQVAKHELLALATKAPTFAGAHAALALVEIRNAYMGDPDRLDDLLKFAQGHATRAVELDEDSSMAHMALSRVYAFQGKYDQAVEEAKMSVAFNPSSAGGYLNLAATLLWGEQTDAALTAIDKAIQLSPRGPLMRLKLLVKGVILYCLDDYGEAERLIRQADASHILAPHTRMVLAAVYVRQGRIDDAKSAMKDALALRPKITMSRLNASWRALAPRYRDKLLGDLERAGLPQ